MRLVRRMRLPCRMEKSWCRSLGRKCLGPHCGDQAQSRLEGLAAPSGLLGAPGCVSHSLCVLDYAGVFVLVVRELCFCPIRVESKLMASLASTDFLHFRRG